MKSNCRTFHSDGDAVVFIAQTAAESAKIIDTVQVIVKFRYIIFSLKTLGPILYFLKNYSFFGDKNEQKQQLNPMLKCSFVFCSPFIKES